MKVICLKKNKSIYTCNAYLVLGSWNTLQDENTLIDIGTDSSISVEIDKINTGLGKNQVDKIIITHEHFDHAGGVMGIKKLYQAKVYAYKRFEGVDEILKDGQIIKIADRYFEVVHTPGHSSDSICLYCAEEGVLFSGDTQYRISTVGGSYSYEYISALEKLMRYNIKTIFSGHDPPVKEDVMSIIKSTLKNVEESITADEKEKKWISN